MTPTLSAVQTGHTPEDTGITQAGRLAAALLDCTADTFALAIKTQAFHWNCTGPLFMALHNLTEEHYQDLINALDDMAERVRALGESAPISASEMLVRSSIPEETEIPDARAMIVSLGEDHALAARRCRKAVQLADEHDDVATADLLTQRIALHEKAIWMLSALAE